MRFINILTVLFCTFGIIEHSVTGEFDFFFWAYIVLLPPNIYYSLYPRTFNG